MKTLTIDASNAEAYQGGFARDDQPLSPEGAFFIRPIDLAAGEQHAGHSHYIDHVGNLVSGQALVKWRREDGSAEGEIVLLVPCKLLIRADTWHEITALTPLRWECWFSRDAAQKLTDEEGRRHYYMEKP